MDAAAQSAGLRDRHIHGAILRVIHVHVPSGIRCDTIARATTTPLRLYDSIQSLSRMPAFSASSTLIRSWDHRERASMNRLSWYSEWIDHLECGVR